MTDTISLQCLHLPTPLRVHVYAKVKNASTFIQTNLLLQALTTKIDVLAALLFTVTN